MALMMFYPFRSLTDLTIEGSYWEKSLKSYIGILNVRSPNFQKKEFKILQNKNDRMTLQKQLKRANDPFYMTTKIEKLNGNIKKDCQKDDTDPDILEMGLDSR
jgi:hypothetical protein